MTLTVSAMLAKMTSVMGKHSMTLIEKIDDLMQSTSWLESQKTLTSYSMGFFEVEIDETFPKEVTDEAAVIYKRDGKWADVRFEKGGTNANTTIVKLIFRQSDSYQDR